MSGTSCFSPCFSIWSRGRLDCKSRSQSSDMSARPRKGGRPLPFTRTMPIVELLLISLLFLVPLVQKPKEISQDYQFRRIAPANSTLGTGLCALVPLGFGVERSINAIRICAMYVHDAFSPDTQAIVTNCQNCENSEVLLAEMEQFLTTMCYIFIVRKFLQLTLRAVPR